jgi:hypothetical protein
MMHGRNNIKSLVHIFRGWPQGTKFCRKELRKKFQMTPPGIDPGTVRLAAQRLNHYATPDPTYGSFDIS